MNEQQNERMASANPQVSGLQCITRPPEGSAF